MNSIAFFVLVAFAWGVIVGAIIVYINHEDTYDQ
jgi:hypothetical protein